MTPEEKADEVLDQFPDLKDQPGIEALRDAIAKAIDEYIGGGDCFGT